MKFFVADVENDNIKYIEVDGGRIEFDCCPNIVFFYHKWTDGLYYVNEATTGTVVTQYGYKKRADAIEEAKKNLSSRTIEEIKQAIAEQKTNGFVSPLIQKRKGMLL